MKNAIAIGILYRVAMLLASTVFTAASLSAQQCPPDEEFPYHFCTENGLVTLCTSDPHHVFDGNGKLMKPFKRHVPACVIIEEPRQSDIWMPKVVTGGPDDSVVVFAFGNQFADIFEAFDQWNRLCPPSNDPPDCCARVVFVHDRHDFPLDPTQEPVYWVVSIDESCRAACNNGFPGEFKILINDTEEWLHGNAVPGANGRVTRAFYTGQNLPGIAPFYKAYSLYQLMEFAAGEWFNLDDGTVPACTHPFSVMANRLTEGPPSDLTRDDICQFKKLYCDHEVGLGVEDERKGGATLSQNIPNPFSALTSIPFSLAKSAHVTVMIHDDRGALVETLLDESMEAGMHAIGFNGAGLPAGTYWYSLYVDGAATARRMILVK